MSDEFELEFSIEFRMVGSLDLKLVCKAQGELQQHTDSSYSPGEAKVAYQPFQDVACS